LRGKQSHKLGNEGMIDHIANSVEARAEPSSRDPKAAEQAARTLPKAAHFAIDRYLRISYRIGYALINAAKNPYIRPQFFCGRWHGACGFAGRGTV